MNYLNMLKQIFTPTLLFTFFFIPLGQAEGISDVHPRGTLVEDNDAVYRITHNARIGYTSSQIFLSYGHRFDEVVNASAGDRALPVTVISPYASGTLIADSGAVYIIFDSKKYGFVSQEVFLGLGYDFADAQSADLFGVALGGVISDPNSAHSYGTLARDTDGTVYLMTPGGFQGIPSMSVFRSHKFHLRRAGIVPLSAADRAAMQSGHLQNFGLLPYASGTLLRTQNGGVYFIENGTKRPFLTEQGFRQMGYRFENAIQTTEQELIAFPIGAPIR